jgi:hypothetical protein
VRGDIKQHLCVGAPLLMGLHAAKQEKTGSAIPRLPRKELAPWPLDGTAPISRHPNVRPFLGKHEEFLGVYQGQPRGREVSDQVLECSSCGLAGIDPSSKRHYHRRQVGKRLAVKFHIVHDHPSSS